jgi:hypothetical protein
MPIVGGPRETLTTLSASKGITSTILNPTSGDFKGQEIYAATFQPKTQAVYVMWDGTDATSAGLALAIGDVLRIEGYWNLKKFRVLEQAASATLLVIPEYRV